MIRFFRISTSAALMLLTALLFQTSTPLSVAQTQKTRAGSGDDEAPLFSEYRSIRIGMTAEEVRKALSNPSDKSDEQDFFVFGENESAQVFYDKSHKSLCHFGQLPERRARATDGQGRIRIGHSA